VIEKLGFLVRFWELKARHATLGEPLTASEQLELLSLMQLVTGDCRVPDPGPAPRTRSSLPAQLIGEGRIMAVEVRSVTAAAVIVASVRDMAAGERVILRAADAVSGVEYSIPCTVMWVYEGGPTTMALVVDGLPARNDFSSGSDAQARSTLAMGRQQRLVG
jgi:hypothetical protein